eukprot:TRINITY_DN11219_c0_g1_i1.p1 TRINITY_DN11219_c0_g1~~TRINITY_DN11219_c0_g1_i1.p1  ORF type:complete len:237 (-),score=57.70 TRINITY_DN11219_c0_g1_i1:38-748(-)
MTSKHDPEREQEALNFVAQITGESLSDFHEDLKSGVVLCNFINTLSPGAVARINKRNMAFMCMENIEAYINASQTFVPTEYSFMTVDLWEGKNLAQVALNIIALKRHFGYGFEKQTAGGETILDIDPLQEQDDRDVDIGPTSEVITNRRALSRTGGARKAGQVQITTPQPCPICTLSVTGACIEAVGQTWHPKCFYCRKCGEPLARKMYFEHNNMAYCDRCILLVNPQTTIRTGNN